MRGLEVEPDGRRARLASVLGYAVAGTAFVILGTLLVYGSGTWPGFWDTVAFLNSRNATVCEQPAVMDPGDRFEPSKHVFFTPEYRNYSLDVWSGAVRIPTESFDDLGNVGEDPRFDVFYDFAAYLQRAFPHVHAAAKLEKVNTHGLLYIFEGSDRDLKPLMLTAHQDVVPVLGDTVDEWTYPPFEAHFDGEFLWGRGSSDCKSQLTAVMEAMEALLAQGFKPRRTVLFAFGFDEEALVAKDGAAHLAPRIEDLYGKDSVFMIVDEGNKIADSYGTVFAQPSVAEKGYLDAVITLGMPGGHSSMPPRHTAIGIAAELVAMLEAHAFEADLTPRNPFYRFLKCAAVHAPDMDESLRADILKMDHSGAAKRRVLNALSSDTSKERFVLQTTQAVDIIRGGHKINALPEVVTVQVNHRISVESSTRNVQDRLSKLAKYVAKAHGLSLHAWGSDLAASEPSRGFLNLTAVSPLEPAPVSPTRGPAWDILGGTTRHVFNHVAPLHNRSVVFAPGIMTGNTDTKFYWNLTRNIFRYGPVPQWQVFNTHTVDERASLSGHLGMVAFFYELIQNVDVHDGN